MDFERTHRRMNEINLTALIDIVFHLMVFVMLTTTFVVSESMELSLPSGKSQTSSATNIMRIHIAPAGGVWVDNQPMSNEALSGVLAERLAVDPDSKIAIFTMPGVSVQQLVSVMDSVYLTGGRNVQVDKAQ
jgi:biopolymer transport protein ExbD